MDNVPLQDRAAQRDALLCALILALCVFVSYPFANEGFGDDFSYAGTALAFARTGHIAYNAWAEPTQGWMILWGALFIKLFGFSFNTLRMATLVVALASVYVFHRTLAGFGISRRNASIGALTLGLSPLYFPLATSFMTDVPALFAMLLCIYMCQSAVAATSARTTILWLVSAAMLNVASGTARQIAWLGALVIVPSTGWLLRKRRGVLLASLASALLSLFLVLALVHWFYSIPNLWLPNLPQRGIPHHYSARTLLEALIHLFLCLLFLVLPLLGACWSTARTLTRRALFRVSAVFGLLLLCLYDAASRGRLVPSVAPWLFGIIGRYPSFGGRPPIDQLFASSFNIPTWLRVVVTLFTFASFLVMAEQLFLRKPRSAPAATVAPSALQSVLWILGPFSAAYVLALLPRAQLVPLLDRYALCLMPLAIALLLLLYQRSIGPAVPTISFIVLAIFTFYAIADTHDYYADQRAGDIAIRKLTAAGVPETSISQSENRDAWLQVSIAGRMHWGGPDVDRGPNPPPLPTRRPAIPCSSYIAPLTPVVQPDYYIVLTPSPCLQPSRYPQVSYRAWLPPFHRNEYIEQPIYALP